MGSKGSPALTKKPVTKPADSAGGTNPAARSYADRARGRKADASVLKKSTTELGHGPPIDPKKGEQIRALVGGAPLPQPQFAQAAKKAPATSEHRAESTPPQKRPVMPGVGGGYSFNQDMAAGKLDGPITLGEAKEMHEEDKKQRGLSPETVSALEMANAAQASAAPSDANGDEEKAEVVYEQEAEGDLDAAERDIVEKTQSARETFPLDLEAISDFRLKLMTKERRKAIESRLTEMDLSDIIMKSELQQEILVVKDKLAITLRTQSQRENLWCLQYIFDFSGSQAYQQELLSTCRLVCSLVSINGKLIPDHREKVGKPDEDVDRTAFEAKLGIVSRMPVQFVADMSVQLMWFEDRVNDLFGHDSLKNG